MLNLCISHITRIGWNGAYSNSVKVLNGVRQGAIISAVLFCIYLDGLLRDTAAVVVLLALRPTQVDDITLLSPTLLSTCER
jgi:hypothetical protein